MPMDTVTEENVAKIMTDKEGKLLEITILEATSIENLWKNELIELNEKSLKWRGKK